MENAIRDTVPLQRYRMALDRIYGDRLARVVLFGSRARGDATPDSDYDIAVFIREPDAWLEEVIRLADAGADIAVDTGALISAKPFPAGADQKTSALMEEIRRDGIDL